MARVLCDCQAQIHALLNNCIRCGKIVCVAEQEGPCLFCGNYVYKKGFLTLDDQQFPDIESRIAYNEAIQHKDKLLDFHKRDIHQSNIIDDQVDYYHMAEDIWENQETRLKAMDRVIMQEEALNKSEMKTQFDFKTGQMTLVKETTNLTVDDFREEARRFMQENARTETAKQGTKRHHLSDDKEALDLYNDLKNSMKQNISKQQKKQNGHQQCVPFNDEFMSEFKKEIESQIAKQEAVCTEQDFDIEFFDINQNSACISMHQPWAQLVVEGFKRIEGRMWCTGYTGPLWIHAGAKVPEVELITAIEAQYEELYRGCKDRPKFPTRYPTGSLIGVVDMVGFMKRESYEAAIEPARREEGETEFKFVFRNPRKLIYPISMKGSNNIFKLDEDIKQIALKNITRVPTSWAPYLVDDTMVEDIKALKEQQRQQAQRSEEQNVKEELQQHFEYKEPTEPRSKGQKQKQDREQKQAQSHQQIEQKMEIQQAAQTQMKLAWCNIRLKVLKNDQLLRLAKALEQNIGKPKPKQMHQATIKGAIVPFYLELSGLPSVDNTELHVYFLRSADKKVTLKRPCKRLFLIGQSLEIQQENQEKIELDQNSLMILENIDIPTVVSYTNNVSQDTLLKEIDQDYTYKTWLIQFL